MYMCRFANQFVHFVIMKDCVRPPQRELENYVQQIVKQIHMLRDSVRHLEFSSIYFGGVHAFRSVSEFLEIIMKTLDESLKFHPNNKQTFWSLINCNFEC